MILKEEKLKQAHNWDATMKHFILKGGLTICNFLCSHYFKFA